MQSDKSKEKQVDTFHLLRGTVDDFKLLLKANWSILPSDFKTNILHKIDNLQLVVDNYPKGLEYLKPVHEEMKRLSTVDKVIDSYIIHLAKEIGADGKLVMNNFGYVEFGYYLAPSEDRS